jgi:hypothetical protein
MIGRDLYRNLFRVSLEEALRAHKRSEVFRNPLFTVGELDDPLEPGNPFVMQAVLRDVEREWFFRRSECVPDWVTLSVGNAARERSLLKFREEYALSPLERYKRVETSIKTELYNPSNPDSWEMNGLFCLIQVPRELSGEGIPVFWAGPRSAALANSRVRAWFFDPRTTVTHGEEAVMLAKEALGKVKGAK